MNLHTKFKCTFEIKDVINIPHQSGKVSLKWYLKDSARPEARGRTEEVEIKDHKVVIDYRREFTFKTTINRKGMLKPRLLVFETVLISRNNRLTIGKLELHLDEIVNAKPEEVNGKYLLQASKANCLVDIAIKVEYEKGPSDYETHPLSVLPIAGDITYVMHQEKASFGPSRSDSMNGGSQANSVVAGSNVSNGTGATAHFTNNIPGVGGRAATNAGHIKDILYKTFVVSWGNERPEDLNPKQCVDDIFRGGSGFGHAQMNIPKTNVLESFLGVADNTGVVSESQRSWTINMAEEDDAPKSDEERRKEEEEEKKQKLARLHTLMKVPTT